MCGSTALRRFRSGQWGVLDCDRFGHSSVRTGRRTNASLETPIDVERLLRSGVLGKQRRHTPRSRRAHRSGVQRTVGALGIGAHRGGKPSLDLRIHEVRPVALNADQGRPRGLVKGIVRIVTAPAGRLLHLFIARLAAIRRIDLCEADSQTAVSGKQDREIGRIDLREIPQDVNQAHGDRAR